MGVDSVLEHCLESEEGSLKITKNTKIKRAIDTVFSGSDPTNFFLYADSTGIQKLVSIVELCGDLARDKGLSFIQLNCFQNDSFYVYLDFKSNKAKQETLRGNGWVYNEMQQEQQDSH